MAPTTQTTTRTYSTPGRGPGSPASAPPTQAPLKQAPPTHACVRCGAPVAIETALCDDCNPLGLSQPASTQVHGIALAGVAAGVIALALIARLSLSGIGPFEGGVSDVRGLADGLTVTLTVANNGTNAGQLTCRVTDPAARFGGASAYILTPRIEAGRTLAFDAEVRQFGSIPRVLAVECNGP